MKILVKVTQEVLAITSNCMRLPDVTVGSQCETIRKNCAIAYAVRKLIPDAEVEETRIHIGNAEVTFCELPPIATRFINEFDNKSPAERVVMFPIAFEIDVPAWYTDMIGISEAYRILSESKTLELIQP
jgi:hypothetical protein